MAVKQAQKFTEEELTTLKTIQSKSQEATIAKQLTEKYGKGTIDIESGEFTPVE